MVLEIAIDLPIRALTHRHYQITSQGPVAEPHLGPNRDFEHCPINVWICLPAECATSSNALSQVFLKRTEGDRSLQSVYLGTLTKHPRLSNMGPRRTS